ncbi:MAG: GntR family transcriptional regulator [Methanocorpusculum sp.]|nr:GntR family transcriptional regulator [Methanocorpusculum sp.]
MYIHDMCNMTQEELVNIIISNASDKPIYEQITAQIKRMIISGELPEGTALPSMRLLAKELRISVITTKRAYTDLERDGFIETVTDKGSFAAGSNLEIIKEEQMRLCEEHLQQAVDIAAQSGITYEELRETLELLYNGE